jgi:uncharacterized membrane protein
MHNSKSRLEAFSDGMFAIILTILVLELKVPHLEDGSFAAFSAAIAELAPKLLSFAFSFFIIAIFWVNHHHLINQIEKVDTKLLWLNIALLFFSSLFPFFTAFIGDYPTNSFVIALYPLNMTISSVIINTIFKHAFVNSDLAPHAKFTPAEKQQWLKRSNTSFFINIATIALAFVWYPAALFIMIAFPFTFVVPELLSKSKNDPL